MIALEKWYEEEECARGDVAQVATTFVTAPKIRL